MKTTPINFPGQKKHVLYLQLIKRVVIVKGDGQAHGGRGEARVLNADGQLESRSDALNLGGEFEWVGGVRGHGHQRRIDRLHVFASRLQAEQI